MTLTVTWGMWSLHQTRSRPSTLSSILPQTHWVIDNMNWNGDWEVGDILNIQFQVTIFSKLSLPQAHFTGAPPDMIYANLDGPGHPICGSGGCL